MLDDFRKRFPLDQLHPDAEPSLVLVHSMHRHDVGMMETREASGFLLGPGSFSRVRDRCMRDLQRDMPLQVRVQSPVDLSECPDTETLLDLEPWP